MSEARPILAVVGMTREAKILGDTPVIIGGGDAAALAAAIEDALRGGVAGVVSFGLCGALDPALKVGDVVVGEAVGDADSWFEADAAWAARIVAAAPHAEPGRFAATSLIKGAAGIHTGTS